MYEESDSRLFFAYLSMFTTKVYVPWNGCYGTVIYLCVNRSISSTWRQRAGYVNTSPPDI